MRLLPYKFTVDVKRGGTEAGVRHPSYYLDSAWFVQRLCENFESCLPTKIGPVEQKFLLTTNLKSWLELDIFDGIPSEIRAMNIDSSIQFVVTKLGRLFWFVSEVLFLQLSERESRFLSEALAFILSQGPCNTGALDITCLVFTLHRYDACYIKSKGLSMSLWKNFNYQVYWLDFKIRFKIRKNSTFTYKESAIQIFEPWIHSIYQ